MTLQFSDLSHGFAGCFLIASPYIANSPFAQSVIFICAHSQNEGTMGIVVNRYLNKPTPEELLKQLGIPSIPQSVQFSISAGGPIENAHGLVLHSAEWEEQGCVSVTNTIKLTASLDVLRQLSLGQGPKKSLLALGHANWEPGQLEDEIQNNLWHIGPCNDDILFSKNFMKKWKDALSEIAIDPHKLSLFMGKA